MTPYVTGENYPVINWGCGEGMDNKSTFNLGEYPTQLYLDWADHWKCLSETPVRLRWYDDFGGPAKTDYSASGMPCDSFHQCPYNLERREDDQLKCNVNTMKCER